jgi:hypothetical protein
VAKLTNGRVIMEVRDDKAEHYALITGYHIVRDEPEQAEVVDAPKPKRGRPPKKAS